MSFHRTVLIGLLCILPGTEIFAQKAAWVAPAGGYVFDAIARSIRPVVGFVGSAYLGPASVDGIEWASLAPNRRSALAVRDGVLLSIADLTAPDGVESLDLVQSPRQALWSADSRRAVILGADGQLVWLTGFGTSVTREASWNFDLPAESGSDSRTWFLLGADPTADKAVVALQTGDQWKVWLAFRTAAAVSLDLTGRPAAAAFDSAGSALFIADQTNHQVLQIRDLDSQPSATPVVTSDVYVADPVGMAVAPSDGRLFLVDRTSHSIRILNSGTGELLGELPLDSAPRSISGLSATRFLIAAGEGTGAPLYFLDTEPGKVSFVPRGE
jgi:hypothetical protein